jgi:phenylpropionate dioxygenase-like ring-hydroxylating dioxygenase large terminal subunit
VFPASVRLKSEGQELLGPRSVLPSLRHSPDIAMFVSQGHLPHLLAPEHYVSQSQHLLELERLFRPAWHLVTTMAELGEAGNFVTLDLFGTPIILRNMDGELCCFLNVCAHRHSQLVSLAKGRSATLKCQYHGWEYKSDGRTGKIPDAQSFRHLEPESRCLKKFRLETWGDLVFVCLAPQAPGLSSFLSPIYERWGPGFEPPFHRAALWHEDLECNWKVAIENALESYHVPNVHAQTFEAMPVDAGCSHELDERYTTFLTIRIDQLTSRMSRARNWLAAREGQPVTNQYEHDNVHPHLNFARMDDFRMVQCVTPTSATTCRYQVAVYCLRSKHRVVDLALRAIQQLMVRGVRRVLKEDSALVPAVQRGLASSPFQGVIGAREERVHRFQQYVLDRCAAPPGDHVELEANPQRTR